MLFFRKFGTKKGQVFFFCKWNDRNLNTALPLATSLLLNILGNSLDILGCIFDTYLKCSFFRFDLLNSFVYLFFIDLHSNIDLLISQVVNFTFQDIDL